MTFQCDRCARCCRHHVVPVTQADVVRLAAQTGLEPGAFLELLSPDQVDLVGEPESLADLPGGHRLVVLSRPNDACVFLQAEDTGGESCSVHAARPSSCRAYPFDRPNRTHAPVSLHPAPLCPPETGHLSVLQDGGEDARAWAKCVAERDRELFEYATWLEAFNRRQRQRRRLGKPRQTAPEFLEQLRSRKLPESSLDPTQIGSPEQVEMDQ